MPKTPKRSIARPLLLALLVATAAGTPAARSAEAVPEPPSSPTRPPSGGTGPGTIPGRTVHNVFGLFSRRNLLPLLAGSVLTGASFLLDDETIDFFARQDLERTGELGEHLGNHYLLIGSFTGLYIAGQVSGNPRFRATTYDLVQGELINNALTFGVKSLVSRERPNGENHLSFPSGHASNAFTWATILQRHYGWHAGVPAYLVAVFIGASRLEEGIHYLSDVVAGATVGVIVGRTVTAGTTDHSAEDVRAGRAGRIVAGPGTRLSIRF